MIYKDLSWINCEDGQRHYFDHNGVSLCGKVEIDPGTAEKNADNRLYPCKLCSEERYGIDP